MSSEGYDKTEGAYVLAANADNMSFILSGSGPDFGGTYWLENYMELQDSGYNTQDYHWIYVIGGGSAMLENNGWTDAAVRSQGLQFDSNSGCGPTGRPSMIATGSGFFWEEVYGSTYCQLGVLVRTFPRSELLRKFRPRPPGH